MGYSRSVRTLPFGHYIFSVIVAIPSKVITVIIRNEMLFSFPFLSMRLTFDCGVDALSLFSTWRFCSREQKIS